MQRLAHLFDSLLNLLVWICASILLFIIISIITEVFLRYLFNRPQEWVLEFSEYALLYITFLSAASILKKEGHITIDILASGFEARKKAFFSAIRYGVCAVVSFVFLYIGGRTAWDHYHRGIYNPTILQIPMAYILVVIPAGGFFLFVQSLIGLHSSCKNLRGQRQE